MKSLNKYLLIPIIFLFGCSPKVHHDYHLHVGENILFKYRSFGINQFSEGTIVALSPDGKEAIINWKYENRWQNLDDLDGEIIPDKNETK